ncbi:MAG TPA: IS630 family transposase [Acidimicrobiales bacterium]|nr:IS630 family transposase [Acidimicrobiales bacterium]
MSQKPLRVRRLTDIEGRQLQQIVRRGGGKTDRSVVKWRRSMVVLASAGGNTVEAIARLVQTSPDRVREMIHRFDEMGMASLDPRWAGGRPRRITTDDETFIVKTATARPESVGLPFTRWSIRKLADYLAKNEHHQVMIGRERLRELLGDNDVTFQHTKTWKESNDPLRDEKLDRIDEVLESHLDHCFAFDEFGPLGILPVKGSSWSQKTKPQRLRANFHKYAGVRQFHGCYSIADDRLFGTVREKKGAANTLAALKQIRAMRPDREQIYVILDNLSAHKGEKIRNWCAKNKVELCFTPTYSSWANPIECQFGPLREFVLNNSDHKNHPVLTRKIHAYLAWRNANAKHPDVIAAQRKERARIRSERQRRWGRPATRAA